jgi:hypothetical protein
METAASTSATHAEPRRNGPFSRLADMLLSCNASFGCFESTEQYD